MNRRSIQLFSILVAIFAPAQLFAELSIGQLYPLKFTDVDGNTLLLTDGHISIVVLVTPSILSKAQLVGDRAPDYCLDDPVYRMITVVRFAKHSRPVRALLTAGARHRLNAEAKRVKPRYEARKIARNPRKDIFAVADFDGTVAAQLGVEQGVMFRVFVFGRKGELLARWNDVPSSEELAAVLQLSH